MAAEEQKRVKMCRYCDGLVEFDVAVCPHCGKELVVEKFDDLEFIPTDAPRGMPSPPPVVEPIVPEAHPVVKPVVPGRGRPPVVAPRRGGGSRPPVAKPMKGPPVAKPMKGPPVVKPVKGPPVAKPIKGPPVVKPVEGSPPVVKPIRAKPKPKPKPRPGPAASPPVVKPIGGRPGEPPLVQPLDDEPPLVAPLPEAGDLPPGVAPLDECPICGADTGEPDAVGGTCGECEAVVCLACLMRANGVRAGDDPAKNREDWEGFLSLGERTIRCPACGRPGIK